MSPTHPRSRRLPRAGVDPIDTESTALALVRAVAAQPPRHETILVLLDDARRGLGLVVVSDTADGDAVVEIADRVLDPGVHDARVAAVVVASIRPDHLQIPGEPAGGDDLADAERWLELDEIADAHGVELVEWFVLGDGVSRPRELVGSALRW